MNFTILVSIKTQESLFCNYLMDQIGTSPSDFNRAQLGVLIQKHSVLYTNFICLEICDYLKGNKFPNTVSDKLTNCKTNFRSDISSFIKRFLSWEIEATNDLFDRLDSILRNNFLQSLNDAAGVDIHDNRQYKLRNFTDNSFGMLSSSDRVLSLEYESNFLSFS